MSDKTVTTIGDPNISRQLINGDWDMTDKSDADFIAECEALLKCANGTATIKDAIKAANATLGMFSEAVERLQRAAQWEAVAAGYCDQLSEKVKEIAELKAKVVQFGMSLVDDGPEHTRILELLKDADR